MKHVVILTLMVAGVQQAAFSQASHNKADPLPDPKAAFLRSLAVPGWGHHYVNKSHWTRGQYHLAAEVILILSYIGLSEHTNNLQQNWYSYGSAEAGVAIKGRSRQFQLAVGDFNSLEAYNDYQARNRNWDQLFADTPENRWQWPDSNSRDLYSKLRNRFERIDQQLPALLGLMIVNRIVSGISAYNRAKQLERQPVESSLFLMPYHSRGIVANFKIQF